MSGSDRPTISPFRALLLRLSEQLSARDLRDMKHLLRDHVGERRREEAQSCLDLWAHLETAGLLTDGRTDLLTDLLDKLHRKDLVRRVEEYENERKGSVNAVSASASPPHPNPVPVQPTPNPVPVQPTPHPVPVRHPTPTQCQPSLHPVPCQSTQPPHSVPVHPTPTQCQSSLPPVQCQSSWSPPPTQCQSAQQTCASAPPVGHVYSQPPLQEEGKSFHLPTSVQSEPHSLSCQTLFNGLPMTVATDGPRGQPESAQHAPGGGNTAQHAPGGESMAQHAPGGGDTSQHAPGGDSTAQHAPGGGDTSQHAPGDKRQTAVRIKEQRFPPKAQNYLETGGYRVGIVGGKHYEIDEEEFVEMDHGSSYRIRLTNTHPRPCDAQLAIDGKEVGTWRLDPHQEVELERPEDEQMCFTFFSTRMAPAAAGIRRGEEENGLVQVTFTPRRGEKRGLRLKTRTVEGTQLPGTTRPAATPPVRTKMSHSAATHS